MKRMSKLLALVLTLVMALSLVNTAFAAEGGTISITGSSSLTYTVYKMFDIEKVIDGYKYKLTTDWADFPSQDGVNAYFKAQDGFVIWTKGNTVSAADGAAVAQLARKYVNTKGLTSTLTVQVGNSVSVPADGYYLLVPNDNSASGVVVVEGGQLVTVQEKIAATDLPTIEKKVQEDSNLTYQDTNDVDIGQTINFRTTITSGAAASKYVLHDKMDSHIEFIGVSSITRGGNLVPTTDYEIIDDTDDGCRFHVVFTDSFCSSLHTGAKIIVTYTGKLIKDAAVDTEHKNETWLTHTTENVETAHDTTSTKTYKVVINKVDQKNNNLAGATFVLKDNIGFYYSVDGNGTVKWQEDKNNATTYTSTGAENDVVFYGVDAEIFTLEETVVPGGYTGMSDVEIDVKTPSKSQTRTVTNVLGTQLPTTGGMGTTLFYVGGGLLVAAAVVLLALKKRKAE